jgi:hypothetical protein
MNSNSANALASSIVLVAAERMPAPASRVLSVRARLGAADIASLVKRGYFLPGGGEDLNAIEQAADAFRGAESRRKI